MAQVYQVADQRGGAAVLVAYRLRMRVADLGWRGAIYPFLLPGTPCLP